MIKIKVTRENMIFHLMSYQFDLLDKDVVDAAMTVDWRLKWSITPKQLAYFKEYAIPLIKKVYRCNRSKAINTFDWFQDNYGLSIRS